jgi:cell division protein FtsB
MKPPKLRWVLFTAVITFLISVMVTSFFKEIKKVEELSATLDKRMEERIAVERDSQELKRKIEFYSTPEGIARLAREQFNLVHSGEVLYKIEVVSSDDKLEIEEHKKN